MRYIPSSCSSAKDDELKWVGRGHTVLKSADDETNFDDEILSVGAQLFVRNEITALGFGLTPCWVTEEFASTTKLGSIRLVPWQMKWAAGWPQNPIVFAVEIARNEMKTSHNIPASWARLEKREQQNWESHLNKFDLHGPYCHHFHSLRMKY